MTSPRRPQNCPKSASPEPREEPSARRRTQPFDRPGVPRTRDVLDAFEIDGEESFPGELCQWDEDEPRGEDM